MANNVIYLDYAASSPCHEDVIEAMLPFFRQNFANPSNINHQLGRDVNDAVNKSRTRLANALNVLSNEIFFTSGATESNNLAIKGLCEGQKYFTHALSRNHIVTSVQEHKSVLECFHEMKKKGFEVTYVKPGANGNIVLEDVEKAVTENTLLVSIMWVNNETGAVNDVENIHAYCKEKKAIFHTDATQWYGKLPPTTKRPPADLLSVSAHKINGPKGVGALFIDHVLQDLIKPMIQGGGQEKNLRSGTLNTAGIVGLGEATRIAWENLDRNYKALSERKEYFEDRIRTEFPTATIQCRAVRRAPHISSVSFKVKPGVNLINNLQHIACSSGSACDSSDNRPSQVLLSLGLTPEEAKNTLRFSFGMLTTKEDVDLAVQHLKDVLRTAS